MAKILVLAKSGFGKTTSYCGRKKLDIKGLNPKETFVVQCIGRAVPNPEFKLCPSTYLMDMVKGNRITIFIFILFIMSTTDNILILRTSFK